MTIKYIAFDGTEFDDEKRCKDYEKDNSKEIRVEMGKARNALRTLDDFCDFLSNTINNNCDNCPLTNLCEATSLSFEEFFNKNTPFGNVDVDGTIIEED